VARNTRACERGRVLEMCWKHHWLVFYQQATVMSLYHLGSDQIITATVMPLFLGSDQIITPPPSLLVILLV
jgi:hypothetical protein